MSGLTCEVRNVWSRGSLFDVDYPKTCSHPCLVNSSNVGIDFENDVDGRARSCLGWWVHVCICQLAHDIDQLAFNVNGQPDG